MEEIIKKKYTYQYINFKLLPIKVRHDYISSTVVLILESIAMAVLRNWLWASSFPIVKMHDSNSLYLLNLSQILKQDTVPLAQSKFSIKVAAVMWCNIMALLNLKLLLHHMTQNHKTVTTNSSHLGLNQHQVLLQGGLVTALSPSSESQCLTTLPPSFKGLDATAGFPVTPNLSFLLVASSLPEVSLL